MTGTVLQADMTHRRWSTQSSPALTPAPSSAGIGKIAPMGGGCHFRSMVVKLPGNEISGSVITGNYHYGNYAQNYRNNHSP